MRGKDEVNLVDFCTENVKCEVSCKAVNEAGASADCMMHIVGLSHAGPGTEYFYVAVENAGQTGLSGRNG